MPTIRKPRKGSMQFWPRNKAKRIYPRVHTWSDKLSETKFLGFAGYKVGMTQVTVIDNNKHSKTKGENIIMPATIIECPPMKIAGIRTYKKMHSGLQADKQVMKKIDKDLLFKNIPNIFLKNL